MNVKGAKKMRGLMCQSPAATTVCMTGDSRSVIVPRRADRERDRTLLIEHAKLLNNSKYTRHVESYGFGSAASADKRLPAVSTSIKSEHLPRSHDQKALTSNLASSDQAFQVVVMRVSLHCQGCAVKVKKHLSKMEGVTSFSIDLKTKRVTVMGHVSPLGVLESVSNVKRAEFWPC